MRSGFLHMLYKSTLLLKYLFNTSYNGFPLITDHWSLIIALSIVWMWMSEWLKLDHYQTNQNHY